MHQSSESIGTIAAALAKAQAELVNPEKSLIATIRSSFPRDSDRSFRYAPLASGLEIIRKSLGRHEIATLQTTSIDSDGGIVRLTTLLAHSSGEWVSSEWPVCPITDTASPQRMGAALTYARRYALFTMVGIAGEDDLDAPDLVQAAGQPTPSNGPSSSGPNGGPGHSARNRAAPAKTILAPEASAVLRAQLITELEVMTTSDDAIAWARRRLPAKNTLTADDARIVEDAFQAKMTALAVDQDPASIAPATATDTDGDHVSATTKQVRSSAVPRPASDLPARQVAPKPNRLRDKRHREFVAAQPCLVCGRKPSDAHHLRFAQPRALGRKVSDEFTVPLCREHHGELHRRGDEARWWKDAAIDAIGIARGLWVQTRSPGAVQFSPGREPPDAPV